ncbi:GNAT family N-acetyltransferase [Nocardia suismassiliense]|uniref:GNAT family N-acetyltransferase n=1 Tax=Nocardia suismassiliense TaxID=2077092 RepID=UPI00131F0D6B|nr:GNAT family N-acetyltransferase [Nocardia suismassiliense]
MTEKFVISELNSPDALAEPIALYRNVFGLRPEDPAPGPRLLAALARNGGLALGAHEGGQLVGFSYGFPGLHLADDGGYGSVYHYLEVLVVRPDRRNFGIGRAMMFRTREIVQRRGLRSMRWAYDPLRADNAHFYLDVLGASGCDFIPDLYGIEETGRDRGRSTDRIIVHWTFTEPARQWPAPPAGLVVGVPEVDPHAEVDTVLLAIDFGPGYQHGRGSSIIQHRIRTSLADLITNGFRAVSCRRAADGLAVYRLVVDTSWPRQARHDSPVR